MIKSRAKGWMRHVLYIGNNKFSQNIRLKTYREETIWQTWDLGKVWCLTV